MNDTSHALQWVEYTATADILNETIIGPKRCDILIVIIKLTEGVNITDT